MRTLLITLSALVAGCSPALPTPSVVILVSLDGFRPDYLGRGATPVLDSLAEAGVRARWMEPSFPSKTFPNHYTLVTGLRPDHHGIIANNIRDAVLGGFSPSDRNAVENARWWGGEPIWVTLARQGGRAGLVFWPGSEAPIGGTYADHWIPFDHAMPLADRVDSILTWLDLPEGRRPSFLTLYASAVDAAGHQFGPGSPLVLDSLSAVDEMVRYLLEGLRARGLADATDLIVVSDHGMTETSADRQILLDQLVNMEDVEVYDWGPAAMLQPRPGKLEEVYRALKDRHPALIVYRREEVPSRLAFGHHPRVPQLVALADEGWTITTSARSRSFRAGGNHGYDNALPAMGALFLAAGPSFARHRIVEPFANVHVYSLLAHLLHVPPAPGDGSLDSVRSVLR